MQLQLAECMYHDYSKQPCIQLQPSESVSCGGPVYCKPGHPDLDGYECIK